jgi:hypothetical protein
MQLQEVVVKNIRKTKPDYFGLRALERIILRELEASEETTIKKMDTGPLQNAQKPSELNSETITKSAVEERTDESVDSGEYEGFFTEEEQQFISEAVQWLGSRENKDLILHQIMRDIDGVRPPAAAAFQPPAQATCDATKGVPAGTH